MKFNYTLVGVCILFLSGCASTDITSGQIGNTLSNSSENKSAEVIVLRRANFISSSVTYLISLNSVNVFAIRYSEYTKFKVAEGEHTISVKCEFLGSWQEESIQFTASQSTSTLILVHPTASCAGITEASSEEIEKFQNALDSYFYIDPKTISNFKE